MPTTYEWDIETWVDDEIVDHNHRNSVHEFGGEELTMAVAEDGYRLVLVRTNEKGRWWAYVTDGELPTHFSDAWDRPCIKVPERFFKEFNL